MEQGRAYVYLHQRSVDAWWSKVDKLDKQPNAQQRRFLKSVIARCQHEYRELNAWNAARRQYKRGALTEPSRLCLLGIPGAGKSHCIHLLRDFFETCLQWSDGTQFKFLATQNSMAELIGGGTVHTWGAIPANKTLAAMKGKQDKDWDTLWENAMSVRWIVIDECSTLSPGALVYAGIFPPRESMFASSLCIPRSSSKTRPTSFRRYQYHIRRRSLAAATCQGHSDLLVPTSAE